MLLKQSSIFCGSQLGNAVGLEDTQAHPFNKGCCPACKAQPCGGVGCSGSGPLPMSLSLCPKGAYLHLGDLHESRNMESLKSSSTAKLITSCISWVDKN